MMYMIWDKDNDKWFKDKYDTVVSARKSAYKRKSYEMYVCKIKGDNADVVGTVMSKNYNKYGRAIYIQNEPLASYFLNPDGTLGQKIND